MWCEANRTLPPPTPATPYSNTATPPPTHAATKAKKGLALFMCLYGAIGGVLQCQHTEQFPNEAWPRIDVPSGFADTQEPHWKGGGCSYFWCQCQWGEWVPACARRLRWRQWLGTRGQTRRPPVCIALKSKDGDTIFGPLPSCLPFTSVFWQQIASHVQSQMAPPYGARAHRVTGSNVGDHRRLKLAVSVFAMKHTKALNITLLEESKLVSHPQFKYFRMCKFHGTYHWSAKDNDA